MRTASTHIARLRLDREDAVGAPGGAITVALCGHWEHPGACRWPHHTAVADTTDGVTTIRTVFVSDPAEAAAIHERITGALVGGVVEGPDGRATWSVLSDAPTEPTADESAMAERLAAGTGGA